MKTLTLIQNDPSLLLLRDGRRLDLGAHELRIGLSLDLLEVHVPLWPAETPTRLLEGMVGDLRLVIHS